MTKCWILCYALLLPVLVFAQESIKRTGEKVYTVLPGSNTSISFVIENKTTEDEIYDLTVKSASTFIQPILPQGQQACKANSKTLYIVPLRIAAETAPGNYNISLYAINKDHGEKLLQIATINVSTLRHLNLTRLSASNFVKAGTSIDAVFLVKNNSNIPEKIQIESNNATLDVPPDLTLMAGESKTIVAKRITDPYLGKNTTQSVDLIIKTSNPEQERLIASETATIIATKPQEDDIYHRFPISASIAYLGMRQRDVFQQGFQAELYGKGNFNDKSTALWEFRALSANPVQYSAFTSYEEYFINYKADKFSAHLGDKVYSSSFLTEYARYGRGAELRFDIDKMTLGGFYNRPRFFRDIKDEFNLFTKYNINQTSNFIVGYLYKTPREIGSTGIGLTNFHSNNPAHLPYLIGKTRLWDKINLLGELAYSKTSNHTGTGYMMQADGVFKHWNGNLIYMRTSPEYAGYFTNTTTWNGNINFKINSKLNLHANYTQDAQNFQRDTLLSAAPYRLSYRFGLNYRYIKNGIITLDHGRQRYEDRLEPQQFNYNERFFRINLQQQMGRFQLNIESQFGKTKNYISDFSGNSAYYTTSLGFEKFNTSFTLFGSYAQTSRYQLKNQEQIFYGGRIVSRFTEKTSLNVFYQNNYLPEEYYQDRNLFEAVFQQQIRSNQTIDLSGRYTFQRGDLKNKDFILSLRYTVRINLPVKKIATYSTLSGNIRNLGIEKIEGIRLLLGNHTSLTDKNGNFIFKNIIPGDYYLEIDRMTTELNAIPDMSFPMAIQVATDKKMNIVNFGMTHAAKIVGHIYLNDAMNTNGAKNVDKLGRASKKPDDVIVEISNGEQTFRKLCDLENDFDFSYLRPGVWICKVYKNKLDQRYKITMDTFQLTLASDQTANIDIQIHKRQREVKYQQDPIKVSYNETNKTK